MNHISFFGLNFLFGYGYVVPHEKNDDWSEDVLRGIV